MTLQLKFLGALVEQLGAQMYPSATATVAELISNAWDADADNVWIKIPLDREWRADDKIVVLDDGNGMTEDQAQAAYLQVGRKRRVVLNTDRSENRNRKLHGRKGLGKLAAFGTARYLDLTTTRDGETTEFRLDYEAIRKMPAGADYDVEDAGHGGSLLDDGGTSLEHGTRVVLSALRLKRTTSKTQFMRSMSRRFSIASTEMAVHINGETLSRFDIPVEFRFPSNDHQPDDLVRVDSDSWGIDHLDGDPAYEVRWWIGFTEKPLAEPDLQGLSILASGKMAQRPFLFNRYQGTQAQLGQEYLVGEVEADWIDTGLDIEDDLIQSNRDQLRLEDERLQALMEWGQTRIGWALRTRGKLKTEKNLKRFENHPKLSELLKDRTAAEKKGWARVAKALSGLPEVTDDNLADVVGPILDASAEAAVRSMMEELEKLDEPERA